MYGGFCQIVHARFLTWCPTCFATPLLHLSLCCVQGGWRDAGRRLRPIHAGLLCNTRACVSRKGKTSLQGLISGSFAAALARQRRRAQPVCGAGGGEAARDGVPERAAVQQRLHRARAKFSTSRHTHHDFQQACLCVHAVHPSMIVAALQYWETHVHASEGGGIMQ